jgi:hypothetical protein
MPGPSRLLAAVAAVLVLLGAGWVSAAETFRDTAHKYALDLPDGWEVVSPKDLRELNTTARQSNPHDALVRLAAFRPVGTVGLARGKNPLAVVISIPNTRPDMTFRDFERELTFLFATRNHGRTILRTPLAFDEQKKRLIVQCNLNDSLAEYSGAFLGKDEVLIVSAAAERRTYPDHVPTFEKIVNSFRFEDPSAPPAPPAPPSFLDRTLGPLGQTEQMAIVGGVVGVLVLVVGVLLLGRSPQRRGPAF